MQMFPQDSSSTGSPFSNQSNQSTDPSSPETNFGGAVDSYTQALQAQAIAQKTGSSGMFNNLVDPKAFAAVFGNGFGLNNGGNTFGYAGSANAGNGSNQSGNVFASGSTSLSGGANTAAARSFTGGGIGVSQTHMQGIPNGQIKIEPGWPSNSAGGQLPSSVASSSRPTQSTGHSPSADQPSFQGFNASGASSRATSVGLSDVTGLNGSIGAGTGVQVIPQAQSRSEPPKRLIDIDMLPVGEASLEAISAEPQRNRVLLQGDPQIINKQRVETAIRVILDFLRSIPPTPTTPPLPPALFNLLPPDPTLTFLSFERINCFRGLRLQAGTTTKAIAKKQLQAGRTPERELAYLETAVYMSGENGRRVYACKRCRLREQRRRASKDASRKKQPSSGSDTSSSNHQASRSGATPSQDYITGANADQYDPHRTNQFIEEPSWNPNRPDWRHEIVLFNSAPEVPIKDGGCVWLPFRVVCYGKCHGEKIGFRIKFTIRSYDGTIIATSLTDPIRITDDHKTDKGAKPKLDPLTSANQPAVPRARKGRASAASSRRQSPAPSEGGESVQSISEAGAVLQKQTPNVRAKPYERPPSQSPAVPVGNLPFPGPGPQGFSDPQGKYSQPPSATVPTMSTLPGVPQLPSDAYNTGFPGGPVPDFSVYDPLPVAGTVSPGALRRPNFKMTPLDGSMGFARSAPHSTSSSNVASPVSALRPLSDDMLMMSDPLLSPQSLSNAFASLSALGNQQQAQQQVQQQAQQQMQMQRQQQSQSLMLSDYMNDQEIANTLNSAMDGLFDASSHASLASSYNDETSGFSGFRDNASGLFSESGVVPDDSMEGFLDFSGGEDQGLAQPPFGSVTSPPGGSSFPPLFDLDLGNSPISQSQYNSPSNPEHEAQLREILSSLAQPSQPQPVVSHVIPAEGPMAGGIQVAVAGQRFAPGMTIMFGNRVAKTTVISDGFCTCELPPAVEAGCVDVVVQGAMRMPGQRVEQFRYLGMDKEMMRLALEVRDQYQGSSSDAAYRLAQRIAQGSHSNSESSDRSSASPMGSNPSPGTFSRTASDAITASTAGAVETTPVPETEEDDLQLTVINFLASIDKHAPGSLRRSGAINHCNKANQTMLHIATVMGFHRLVRRLIVIGAHLDLQDSNGFTPLSLASLCGQVGCARVLIEAGAAYDRPTNFGEMPLDLAKVGEKTEIEALLLSAVWSTSPEPPSTAADSETLLDTDAEIEAELLAASSSQDQDTTSEIDNDNPSSSSEVDDELSRVKPLRRRLSRRARGKQRAPTPPLPALSTSSSPKRSPSSASLSTTPHATPALSISAIPPDDPPPYDDSAISPTSDVGPRGSWMARTLSNISHPGVPPPLKIPGTVWNRLPLPSLFDKALSPTSADTVEAQTLVAPAENQQPQHGWIALPAPSWEMLQKMTSPEEVKLFTQAMAASALNAILQSTTGYEGFASASIGSVISPRTASFASEGSAGGRVRGRSKKSRRGSAVAGSGSGSGSSSGSRDKNGRKARRESRSEGSDAVAIQVSAEEKIVKQVKQDRMLYLFWLPILLFVGFWLLVTALPIATGFCLIYARQITRAIKQKI